MAAAALELFSLLSRSAVSFLESHGDKPGLVVLTIELEDKLPQLCALNAASAPQPRLMGSPFRVPLTRCGFRVLS